MPYNILIDNSRNWIHWIPADTNSIHIIRSRSRGRTKNCWFSVCIHLTSLHTQAGHIRCGERRNDTSNVGTLISFKAGALEHLGLLLQEGIDRQPDIWNDVWWATLHTQKSTYSIGRLELTTGLLFSLVVTLLIWYLECISCQSNRSPFVSIHSQSNVSVFIFPLPTSKDELFRWRSKERPDWKVRT